MSRHRAVIEGDIDDPRSPDGDIMETPDGHRYEMGVRHECGHPDCPANITTSDGSSTGND